MPNPRHDPPLLARAYPTNQIPPVLAALLHEADVNLPNPFRGVATSSEIESGLFPLAPSGVSTAAMLAAAHHLLGALDPSRRSAVSFPIDAIEWRKWNNTHPGFMRHGLCLEQMSTGERELALALVASAMSADGFGIARNVMRLNETLRIMTSSDLEYGEWLYWISIMGEPSASEPWGFQFDGHHACINCFILGDQVVLTPTFLGSEVIDAPVGPYVGTSILRPEEAMGIALAKTLDPDQYAAALLGLEIPRDVYAGAYRDNLELQFEGVAFHDLTEQQQENLVALIGRYVGWLPVGHAECRMEEIRLHLNRTFFSWMGERESDSVFYYRIHSPVVLIEFDHLPGVAFDNAQPTRDHIHTIIRTPNGNDYGRDLLRQHHELKHPRAPGA